MNVTIVSLSGFHFNDTALSPGGHCPVRAGRVNRIEIAVDIIDAPRWENALIEVVLDDCLNHC